jgi:DNA polymerase-3 subunit epsilon
MRQLTLDTETTGLLPEKGHKIIEIGVVEIIKRKITSNNFHTFCNPNRNIDQGAFEVHGISSEFLSDKPEFSSVVGDFLEFVKGSELFIHNAPFDVSFLDKELSLCGLKNLNYYCDVVDTLELSRKKYPGKKNSLDALCERLKIDNSHRNLHGALLDSQLLAEVYLAMTRGQEILNYESNNEIKSKQKDSGHLKFKINHKPKIFLASEGENVEHQKFLEFINNEKV